MTLTHRFVCRRVMAGWTSASAEVEQSLHLVQSPQHTHGEDSSLVLPLQSLGTLVSMRHKTASYLLFNTL